MPKIYFHEMIPEIEHIDPTPAIRSMPQWWKDMPKHSGISTHAMQRNMSESGSMRTCPAVNDAMYAGYTVYFPSDLYIDATKRQLQARCQQFIQNDKIWESFPYYKIHEERIAHGFVGGQDYHPETIKIQTYWGVRTEKGYSSFFMHPTNRYDLPFYAAPAIVDTDVYPTWFPYTMYVKKGFQGVIQRGTPFLQIFPFRREEKWEMEFEEFDQKLLNRRDSGLLQKFSQPYKKLYWTRKKFI